MKKIILMTVVFLLASMPLVNAMVEYDCIDSNTLRKTKTINITSDGDVDTIEQVSVLNCPSGCVATGCQWGENYIFNFMVGVVVLFVIGYLATSPSVMVIASILGMSFLAISIRYGFYIGDTYFYGSFIRLVLIVLFLTFGGLMFWGIELGKALRKKDEDEEGEIIGRR